MDGVFTCEDGQGAAWCVSEVEPEPNSDDGLVDENSDGVSDDIDNCPELDNPDQLDTDGNGVGDACDDDGQGSASGAVSSDCECSAPAGNYVRSWHLLATRR